MNQNNRKIIGILAMIIGAVMLLFSDYIAQRVSEGRAEIQQGQRTVNSIESLFNSSSYTKPFAQEITRPAQRRIDRGVAEANRYENLSNQFKVAGVILFAIGLALYFISGDSKKKD